VEGKWSESAKNKALLVLYYFRTGRAFLLKIVVKFEPYFKKSPLIGESEGNQSKPGGRMKQW